MSQNNNGFKSFVAATALSEGTRVTINSSGQAALAGASVIGVGVAQADVASGSLVTVKLFNDNGTFQLVVASSSVAAGAMLYAAANGQVTTTSNSYPIGMALEAGAEAGALIECARVSVV